MSDVRYVHQHFDRPARFGWFTAFEWALVGLAALVTAIWWRWISWMDFSGTCTVAVVLNFPLYAYAQLRQGRGALGLRLRVRVIWSWRRRPRGATGGRATNPAGYAVGHDPSPLPQRAAPVRSRPDFDALWS